MNKLTFVLIALLTVAGASAFELNSLNSIEYVEGQQIDLSTKILSDAVTVFDASCGVYALKDSDNSTVLNRVNMTYDAVEEGYAYFWTPQLTWWENIQQVWDPSIGDYHAYIDCTGGELGSTVLNDVVELRVIA